MMNVPRRTAPTRPSVGGARPTLADAERDAVKTPGAAA